ncbi:MAG: transposase [Balneolaceae bacterium]
MTYIGIDLHSMNMVIVAINGKGEQLIEAKMDASPAVLEEFFDCLDGLLKVVVECTCFWFWISDWFRSRNIPMVLDHTKMVKAISYAKVKTDKVDARTLAELLKAGLIPEAYQIQPERR